MGSPRLVLRRKKALVHWRVLYRGLSLRGTNLTTAGALDAIQKRVALLDRLAEAQQAPDDSDGGR